MAWYDESMTAAKIAITLPRPLLAKVKGAVKRGRASSVSAFVSDALEARVREESLASLVNDLIAEHGEPSRKDEAWARRVLGLKAR
jgi:Arc/MetJ-type ribon-helix-helix transcriptional regulator